MKKSPIDALIMEQENLKSLGREEIERVQLTKLNALFRREHERGGFYSSLPIALKSLDELQNLPFTTEAELSTQGNSILLGSQSRVQRVLSDATSGTTGRAKRVFYTAQDCENTVRLFMAGLSELVYPGSITMICMPFSGEYGLGELIADSISRLGATPLKTGVSLSYGELKNCIERFSPDTYVGMPSALLSLLRVCGRGSLKRALISGDACTPVIISESERILGTRPFPHYGSREMGLGGAICCFAHDGMHLRENHVIAEIIGEDGKALPKGQRGELVITTVGMEAFPLIRYRTGDYTRVLSEPCPCGSQTLRLDSVARRGGEAMSQLNDALFALPNMVDFRARQGAGELYIEALTSGEPDKTAISDAAGGAVVTARKVRMDDIPLYVGKRTILQQQTTVCVYNEIIV